MRKRIRKFLYGPPNWLVTKFDAEDRRMFGFWNVVVAICLTPFFGGKVLFVTVLSIVALIPNISSETPVEIENTHEIAEAVANESTD